jgi:hypothetical protein
MAEEKDTTAETGKGDEEALERKRLCSSRLGPVDTEASAVEGQNNGNTALCVGELQILTIGMVQLDVDGENEE